jgi:aspartyl-tRNA synthetase
MNKNAQDVMMDAPGYVTEKQLKELSIKIDIEQTEAEKPEES